MYNLTNSILIIGVFMSALAVAPTEVRAGGCEKILLETANEKATLAKRDPVYLFIKKDEEHGGPIMPLKLTDNVVNLLKLDDLYDEKDSLAEVVSKTQKKWIAVVQGKNMQGGAVHATGTTERTDLTDSSDHAITRKKVENIAWEMGLFDGRSPALSNYKYGAWLGAFLDGVRDRLHSLVKEWENGHRFEKLVVFTGERDLRKEKGQQDDIEKLCDPNQSPLPFKKGWTLPPDAKYETEYDMMRLVFDQVQLPKDMEDALKDNIEFVNASKVKHPVTGEAVRPGTKDCYVTWLKRNPEKGTIVAASTPLLWTAQHIAGETILGDDYPMDTIAPELSKEEYERRQHAVVSLVHDTVAKCLYEINNQLEAKKAKVSEQLIKTI
jgi:hypothetical protein